MSGTPSETELQAQWRAVVDILESFRAHVDGVQFPAGGLVDVMIQTLEGDYTPSELANWANTLRSTCSSLVSPSFVRDAIRPILRDYAARIDIDATGTQGFGTARRSDSALWRALYDWFVDNSLTVETRAITYGTPAAGGSNVGTGTLGRLTVDENGFDMEACHVERKLFRCIADQNTGKRQGNETFLVLGAAETYDNILRAAHGSGRAGESVMIAKNAGFGDGGSFLNNSSFSQYSATATTKFAGWAETSGGADISQDTSNFYRTHPGASVDAALRMTWNSTTITITQTLGSFRQQRISPDQPYQLRVMVNADIGSAADGTLTLRLGSEEKVVDLDTIIAAGDWYEVVMDFDEYLWPRNFLEDDFGVSISWAGGSGGYLVIDDVIFAPLDFIDGTYWFLRDNHATAPTQFQIDDTFVVTDTGGAPSTGIVQWWNFVSGFGYLPSSATPTFADPS